MTINDIFESIGEVLGTINSNINSYSQFNIDNYIKQMMEKINNDKESRLEYVKNIKIHQKIMDINMKTISIITDILNTVSNIKNDLEINNPGKNDFKRILNGLEKRNELMINSLNILKTDSMNKIKLIFEQQRELCLYDDKCDRSKILSADDLAKLKTVIDNENKYNEILDKETIDRISETTKIKLYYSNDMPEYKEYLQNGGTNDNMNDNIDNINKKFNKEKLHELTLIMYNLSNINKILKIMYDYGLYVNINPETIEKHNFENYTKVIDPMKEILEEHLKSYVNDIKFNEQ